MYTFTKEERLCNKKLLDELFRNGSSFLVYPFRITFKYATLPEQVLAQVVISVPKKRYKRAHDRNLIKRRIREAYRLHKADLFYPELNNNNRQLILGISYIGKEINDYQFIEKKLKLVFERLKAAYDEPKEG